MASSTLQDLCVLVWNLSMSVFPFPNLSIPYGDAPDAVLLSMADIIARDQDPSLEEFHVCLESRY